MKIKIKGKNRFLELPIYKNDINWTKDLIDNAGMFSKSVDNGGFELWYDDNNDPITHCGENVYITTQSTFDWWSSYIDDLNTIEYDLNDLADELNGLGYNAAEILVDDYHNKIRDIYEENDRTKANVLMAVIRHKYIQSQKI